MHRTPEERIAELQRLFDELARQAAARLQRKAQEAARVRNLRLLAANDDCCCGTWKCHAATETSYEDSVISSRL